MIGPDALTIALHDLVVEAVRDEVARQLAEQAYLAPVPTTPFDGHLRFTVAEAADYTRKGRPVIHAALAAGDLHGDQIRKGGRWSIHRNCLDAWITGHRCRHQRLRSAS